VSGLGRLLAAQVATDLRALPTTVRSRVTAAGRVERCQNIAELRLLARRKIPRAVFDYADGAAWDEVTAERNRTDFAQLTIRPRMLVDVSTVDTSTTLAGRTVALPLVGAPTGLTGLFHHRGEAGIAAAVHAAGCIYTLSTAATYSIEEIAAVAPGSTWFQIYMWRDRGLVQELLDRARRAGYSALVVTVDAPRAGPRERDVRNRFSVPPRLTLRSFLEGCRKPGWSAAFVTRPRVSFANIAPRIGDSGVVTMSRFINEQFDPSRTWSELEWLRDVWGGPVYVKGILRDDDARTAVELGAAGVIVSNHGGRQLDTAPSSISVLPEIVQAVGAEAEVILDGGVRRGTDVVKALALGARACMVGRPLVYGLAAGGEAGAARALAILADELRLAMALAGCASIEAIDESVVGPTIADEAGRSA
jgi:isopentenyl diphosphate isomerase/L-lactate dehydrogenase-like FMN-dependent dehydrogenase